MKTISTDRAPLPVGPYSQSILTEVGNHLFISGQLGLERSGKIVRSGVGAEAKQVLINLEAIIASAAMEKNNIVKTTIFLKNMSDFSVVNDVYESFFGVHKQARSTVEASNLPKRGLIEIEDIAVKEINIHLR